MHVSTVFHRVGCTVWGMNNASKSWVWKGAKLQKVNNKFLNAKESEPPRSEVIHFSGFIRSSLESCRVHFGVQQSLVGGFFWLSFPKQSATKTGCRSGSAAWRLSSNNKMGKSCDFPIKLIKAKHPFTSECSCHCARTTKYGGPEGLISQSTKTLKITEKVGQTLSVIGQNSSLSCHFMFVFTTLTSVYAYILI